MATKNVRRVMEFPLEAGGQVLVEVEELQLDGVIRAARTGEVTERAVQTFESALESVRPAAGAIVKKLRELAPDELGVEFGIKFTAEAGVVVATTGMEANFRVTMTWKQTKTAPGS